MKMKSALAVALALATASPMTSALAPGSPGPDVDHPAVTPRVTWCRRATVALAIALGIGAVVGTAIILSEAARAEGHRRYRRSSYCGDLLYRCEDGSRWACRKFQDRC